MDRPPGLALALTLALLLLAGPALAADEPEGAAAAPPQAGEQPAGDLPPGQALAAVLLGGILVAGAGCLLAVLRTVFPGPTRLADDAVGRLGTGRLLLAGVLPAVGVALLGAGAERSGVQGLGLAWGALLGLPALLLSLLGAMAAIPHLGATLLRGGVDRSLLARSVVGSLTLGLAMVAAVWALKPLAPVVLAVLVGWFLGIGLAIFLRPKPEGGPTPPPAA